jgi:glutathione S-transferase
VDPWATAADGVAGPIIRLVQFPPVWGRNVSPFALKLETWLRLSGIPFEVSTSLKLDKAPKRKFPYIHDGPLAIGDSSLVIRHLKTTRGIDPDSGLHEDELAQAVALQRLFEDHLYFILAYSRWLDPEGFAVIGPAFLAFLPKAVRPAASMLVRMRIRRMLWSQGIARHAPDEIYAFGREDLHAVSAFLADKPFFMGEQLTTIDAVAYGFLANILFVPVETELKRAALDFPNLVAWCESIESGLYGET